MSRHPVYRWRLTLALVLAAVPLAWPEQRFESFDSDPHWDGLNNRPPANSTRHVVQDFGYAPDTRQGIGPGAIGGTVTPDGVAAYYAKEIPAKTLNDAFTASGTLFVKEGAGNTLFGFFNSQTVNEWRTPNTLVFRINGRGEIFHTHVEYATSKWRAGAGVIGRYDKQADRIYPVETPSRGVHRWSINYDPAGANGAGSITATFDDQRAVCDLVDGHKRDGATFDRFGILNVIKSVDSPGELWLGSLVINGVSETLDHDPKWQGLRNRCAYESEEVRPRFNFGFASSHYAGGKAPGEIGGRFFRGDCRYPASLAYYGAKLDTLTLNQPLRASGVLTLRRGVSDSTTLFGFFHAVHSVAVNPSQKSAIPMNFLGFAIEGPSSEGFSVYPLYRVHGAPEGAAPPRSAPRIYPDGASLHWRLEYDPAANNGAGAIVVSLGDASSALSLAPGARDVATVFNRFGLITPWIDGNGQVVYLDDIEYTCK